MASSGKKGKKSKGRTVALTDFLADEGTGSVNRFARKTNNWADDVENDDDIHDSRKDKFVLPTAPRATLGTEVDDSKIPTNPPFLAYISNLPYEMDEEEIAAFFKDLKILSVRLPKDDRGMGKFKGFGYVEFENRASLISALSLPETTIKSRRMRIDVAENSDNDRRRGRDMMRGDLMGRDRFDGPDRTLGDWRSGPREDLTSDSDRDRGSGFRDRDGGGFRGRDGEYQMADNWDNRQRGGRDRPDGPDRSMGDWRSGQREDPPLPDSERDGGFDRGGRSGGRRDFGSGGFRDNFGDRDRERGGGFRDSRDNYGDRDRGRFGGDREGFDRGGGGGGGGSGSSFGDRDRRGADRDFGGSWRSYGDYGRDSRDGGGFRGGRDDGPPERGGEPSTVDPKSRPRLNLKPRTKPVEEIAVSEPSMPAPAAVPSGAPASIFGGAKPVNTAAKEREIEERLAREKGEVLRGPVREDKGEDLRSKSGSEHGDDDSVHGPVAPSRRVEPAPPPSENYWMQRTQQTQGSRNESLLEDNGHVSPHSDHLEHREPQRRYQDRPESPRRWNEGEYDERQQPSRGPPRETYERDDRGGRDERGGRDDRGGRGPPGPRGGGGGPTRGGDRQRGRGEGRPMSDRDHRKDVGHEDPSRMPKYRESETPNFVASNKFAYLHSDEEQSNGSD